MENQFILILLVAIWISKASTAISGDYCAHEYFHPTCSVNEVIVMERAIYGRMKLGRCLEMDPNDQNFNNTKYIGCSSDVLDILDQRCSGLKTCNVQVIDPDLIKRSTCYRGLMLYLSAKYSCYSVATPDRSCSISVGSEPSHIAFNVINDNKCLSNGSTIILEASHGQTINASVIVFNRGMSDPDNGSIPKRGRLDSVVDVCYEGSLTSKTIGHFRSLDGSSQDVQRIDVCSGEPRQRSVFVSKTNKIQFHHSQISKWRFLLTFIATGCYDLKPPQDAWMKREGKEITVGCYMNRHTWKLFCNGRNWVGVIGNCTQLNEPLQLDANDQISSHNDSLSQRTQNVFIVLVLVCLLLLTLTLVSCVILYCCQRRNPFQKPKNLYLENGNCSFKVANVNPLLNQLAKEANIEEFTAQKKDIDGSSDPCYYVLEGQTDND